MLCQFLCSIYILYYYYCCNACFHCSAYVYSSSLLLAQRFYIALSFCFFDIILSFKDFDHSFRNYCKIPVTFFTHLRNTAIIIIPLDSSLCNHMHRNTSNAFPVLTSLYLSQAGCRRRGIELFGCLRLYRPARKLVLNLYQAVWAMAAKAPPTWPQSNHHYDIRYFEYSDGR